MGYNAIISMMPKVPAIVYDPDAQLFFNAQAAAGVTLTLTQKSAVNQWVIDSKAAGIWTKMKAIYPFVGSTATSQKFNLKNPLDTNAAFRLNFIGGGTHSSNGYQPNGINAYADTFLNGTLNLTANNSHISFYSRTNVDNIAMDFGNTANAFGSITRQGNIIYSDFLGNGIPGLASPDRISVANTSSNANFIFSSTSSNIKIYKNSAILGQKGSATASAYPNSNILLSYGFTSSAARYSNRELAFSSIGDGLTDLESQLFYQITEKYQVALSRNVNPTQSFYYNPAYNNETNAFLFSTQITDNTIQTATNTLVTDLKTAGVFTKMKALYPMVGGTATTHKFNLANAQDTDAAFRLAFVGGWTHSANGALPNGTNAYANTYLTPSLVTTLNSTHLSYYSRTNTIPVNFSINIGCWNGAGVHYTILSIRSLSGASYSVLQTSVTTSYPTFADSDSLGLYTTTRTSSTLTKMYKNGTLRASNGTSSTGQPVPLTTIYIGAANGNTFNYSNRECAFASIGDGLSDAEALAFYNAVQTFNTTLARNV